MFKNWKIALPLSFSFLCFLFTNFLYSAEEPTHFKVIAFDFGSVIAKTDKKEVIAFISDSLKVPPGDLDAVFLKMKQNENIEDKHFWEDFAKQRGITLPSDWFVKLEQVKISALKETPGMIELVKKLQAQGYQTALLSNTKISAAAIKRKLGYYKLFHPVILSHEIGIRKPDLRAYETLLSKLHVTANEVLFIDDKAANVAAAKQAGMDSILFVGTDNLIEELKKRGIDLSKPH